MNGNVRAASLKYEEDHKSNYKNKDEEYEYDDDDHNDDHDEEEAYKEDETVNWSSFSVRELKEELTKRSIKPVGNKVDLVLLLRPFGKLKEYKRERLIPNRNDLISISFFAICLSASRSMPPIQNA